MTKDLEVLFPEPRVVEAGGETITISPFKFRQLKKVAFYVTRLMKHVQGDDLEDLDIPGLITEGGDDITQILAISTGLSVEFIDELELDVVLELTFAVFEVNRDFFTQKVAGKFETMTAGLKGLQAA